MVWCKLCKWCKCNGCFISRFYRLATREARRRLVLRLLLYIFECFHDQQDSQWRKKALRKYPTKQQQNGQIVFLLSDGLAQYCVNLSCWFTHETAFSTEQCTTPSLFHNFEVSQGARTHSLKHYGFQFGTPFSLFVLTHAHLKVT